MKLPQKPRRVVVTGMASISPLGSSWEKVRDALEKNRSGIRHMTEWEKLEDLNTRVAAPAAPFELDPEVFTRKRTRSMGRVALMAVKTARDALIDAGLLDDPIVSSDRTGVAFGSSAGQPAAVAELAHLILSSSCRGITATTYVPPSTSASSSAARGGSARPRQPAPRARRASDLPTRRLRRGAPTS